MQLVAYGAQDLSLTGSPEITYWRSVHKRHTPFAVESVEQTFSGAIDFGKRVTVTVSRNGDLLSNSWLEIKLKQNGPTYYPAEALIKEIELEIGGQKIDRHYSDWFRIHDELFHTKEQKDAYKRMTNFDLDSESAEPEEGQTGVIRRLYLPLNFFFCKEPGLAFPLVACQFHEIRLHVTLAQATEILGIDPTYTPEVKMYCAYTFLESEERKRYATQSHEMLITQVQHTGAETLPVAVGASTSTSVSTVNVRLNFNHPTRYLAFVVKGTQHGVYSTAAPVAWLGSAINGTDPKADAAMHNDAYAPIHTVKLQLNAHDRASVRHGKWYNQAVPYECCSSRPAGGIYLYSFSLDPRKTAQPSGTCNFSRIDNATLQLQLKRVTLDGNGDPHATPAAVADEDVIVHDALGYNLRNLLVFAESFNLLRVVSGMAGLAFSN
jgi:hypothetical protein